jgi:hypothetical protein
VKARKCALGLQFIAKLKKSKRFLISISFNKPMGASY